MKWCIPLIALLVLTGCGNSQSRQLTPEEQKRLSVERHCQNTAQLAKSQMGPTPRTPGVGSYDPGFVTPGEAFADSFTLAQNQKRAYRVTYQNCMAQYGYWP